MFFDLFDELCKVKGVSPNRACIEIGVSRTAVAKWKAGGTPNGSTTAKIASYFGVSTDYLLGKEKKPASKEDELIKDEFIAFYGEVKEDLDEDDINDLKTFMRMKAEIKRKNEKKE